MCISFLLCVVFLRQFPARIFERDSAEQKATGLQGLLKATGAPAEGPYAQVRFFSSNAWFFTHSETIVCD